MENNVLLLFDNVSYAYDEEPENGELVYAVKDVSFEIKKGEFVAVLGSNGSGKSTIAKLSNSVFLPTKGKVFAGGLDTSLPENEFEARKKIGVVFQNPDNQIVASIVEEDVAFGPENLGLPPDEIRRRVDNALKETGMYEYRMHETHRLSGGQKQRVAISGILAMQPECIVLDEPTAMLDPKGRSDVLSTIKRLNKELGVTVVLITHFMDEAANADRVIIINNAELAADSVPEKIFSDIPLLRKCKLGVPEAAELAGLLQDRGVRFDGKIVTEDDFVKEFVRFFPERSK